MKKLTMNRICFVVEDKSKSYSFLTENLPHEVAKISCIGKKSIKDRIDANALYICNTKSEYIKLLNQGIVAVYWESNLGGENISGNEFTEYEPNTRKPKYVVQDIEQLEWEDYEHIYNRINRLPCEILRTERLIVRETTVADVDAFLELYKDPSITMYMEDLFEPDKEREYQADYITNIYEFYDIGMWTLALITPDGKEGNIIGRMGIEMTEQEGVAEMGFMLGCDYQGRGYAVEAGRAILEYVRTVSGIKTIRAKVHERNVSSQNLCKKLGMKNINNDIWVKDI